MIVVDTRESSASSGIYNALIKLGVDVKTDKLPVDYYVYGAKGEAFIERKNVLDFVASWRTGRIFNQLDTLSALKTNQIKSILLIEGSMHLPVKIRKWRKEGVMGILASSTVSWDIQTVFTPSMQYTILFLKSLDNILGKTEKEPHPIEVKPKALTLQEEALRVLESLPFVSATLSRRILEHYGSVMNAFQNVDDWKQVVEGIGEMKEERIKKVLFTNFNKEGEKDDG